MTQDIEEIEKKVIEILADKSGVDGEKIHLRSSLVDDLGMDSLDAVETVFEVEERYGIDIPDDQIQEFKIVQDIVNYLVSMLNPP